MLEWIANLFKYPMQWFYGITGNYLVSLILFALLVKIIFIPAAIHQQKTQIKGAKLRPKIAIIEKKYAGRTDRESQQQKQQEIMELQQKEGYSPFAGCLPLLLQLPVLIGLYEVIRKPLTYLMNATTETIEKICEKVNAIQGGAGTTFDASSDQISLIKVINQNQIDISDQLAGTGSSSLPDLTIFGGSINLGDTPGFNNGSSLWLLLIPVLTFALAFLSMKVSRHFSAQPTQAANTPEMQASNRIMELSMPLLGVFICFTVPAAVGFYWLCGYVFAILQTVILAKLMPLPTFTEEEIRRYEKEMKASYAKSNQSAPRAVTSAGKRSLHHIDDDDEDAATPAPQVKKAQTEKKNGAISLAPQKEDEKKDDEKQENDGV